MEVFLSRYACKVCGKEWDIVEDVHVNEDYPQGIPSYRWTPCPEHPDARSRLLCAVCGDRSLRCSAKGCQRGDSLQHGFIGFAQDEYAFVALCDEHWENDEYTEISKHVDFPYTETEMRAAEGQWGIRPT